MMFNNVFFPDTKPDVGMGRIINPWVRGSIGTHRSVRNALLELGLGWWWLNMKTKKESYHVQKGDELD